MLSEGLSLITALGGVVTIVTMLLRSRRLTSLARNAIIASAFGLFMASRYAEDARSPGAVIFTIGVAGIMAQLAIRHLRAARTEQAA